MSTDFSWGKHVRNSGVPWRAEKFLPQAEQRRQRMPLALLDQPCGRRVEAPRTP